MKYWHDYIDEVEIKIENPYIFADEKYTYKKDVVFKSPKLRQEYLDVYMNKTLVGSLYEKHIPLYHPSEYYDTGGPRKYNTIKRKGLYYFCPFEKHMVTSFNDKTGRNQKFWDRSFKFDKETSWFECDICDVKSDTGQYLLNV